MYVNAQFTNVAIICAVDLCSLVMIDSREYHLFLAENEIIIKRMQFYK